MQQGLSEESELDAVTVGYPKERPPIFRGSDDPYATWGEEFFEYSKVYNFSPSLRRKFGLQ